MLKVNHLYKSYRSGSNVYEVLKDVNFEVRKGAVSYTHLTLPTILLV